MDSRQRLQEALQLHRAGDYAAAEAVYRDVLAADPKNADALHLMGALASAVGHHEAAAKLIRAAIAIKPNVASFHNSLGDALFKDKRLVDAMFAYRGAVDLKSDYAQALAGLGATLREMARFAEAIEPLSRAIELKPNLADAHYNLGIALDAEGKLPEAAAAMKQFVAMKPADANGHAVLGVVQSKLGETSAAVASLHKAIEMVPHQVDLRVRLVAAMVSSGKLDDAIAECRRAIEIAPQSAILQMHLGKILLEQNKIDDAITTLRKATDLQTNSATAFLELGDAWLKFGRVDQALDNYARAVEIDRANVTANSRRLLALTYDARATAEEVFHQHRVWSQNFSDAQHHQIRPHTNDPDADRKLRIGYLSPHFCAHPVANLMTPVLAAHNREQFEVYCYADVAKPDAMTRQVQGMADQWRSVRGLTDEQAAAMIREDRIDVLIDLAGHLQGGRPAVLATRPAPVQLSYLGYPHSLAARAVDGRITDAVMDPPGLTESLHTEELIRIDGGAFAYLPPASAADVSELPALSAGHVTFGSIADFARVTPPLVTLWAEILKELPTSRLIATADDRVSARKRLGAMLERQEIPEDRFDVVSRKSRSETLSLFNRVDVLLDSFPFNTGLPVCDALWMGVPVISLAGGTPASRQGASLLTAAGQTDAIAESTDDYAAIAYRMASDLPKLIHTRESLREKVQASPLVDTAGLAAKLEAAYRGAWRKWAAGKTGS